MPETNVSRSYGVRNLEEQQAAYDQWAEAYEPDLCAMGYRIPTILSTVFTHFVSPGAVPILDAGCGGGIQAEAIAMLGYGPITGIDLSEGMLKVAQERIDEHRLDHVTLQRMDAGQMNFEDNSFDLVMAAYVVTAVPDYRKVVSEMIRVCRPGGRIVMLNHFSNGNKLIAAVEKLISPMCQRIGFRTDLSLNHVLESTSLQVTKKEKMNPLRFWYLVECVNAKNSHSVS